MNTSNWFALGWKSHLRQFAWTFSAFLVFGLATAIAQGKAPEVLNDSDIPLLTEESDSEIQVFGAGDEPEDVSPEAIPSDNEASAPDTSDDPETLIGIVPEDALEAEPFVESMVPEGGAIAVPGAPPARYTITQGDTLWDICSKLLDNPWYWPKLWSLNQYIKNPHLIFPGDELVFFAGTETAPPRLDIESDRSPTAQSETPGVEEPLEPPMEPDPTILLPTDDEPKGGRQIRLKAESYVAEQKLKYLGKVSHSGETKKELTFGDRVYLSFYKKMQVSVGDRFHVVRIRQKVKDPDKFFGKMGNLVQRSATLKIIAIHKKTIEALIIDVIDSVVRGDKFIAYKSPIRVVRPHDTEKDLRGKIAAAENQQYMISQNEFVYLNIGEKQGLEDGQQLMVVRRGDGVFQGGDQHLPDVPMGRLIVVETGENTATAYVTEIRRSLEVGDRVRSTLN